MLQRFTSVHALTNGMFGIGSSSWPGFAMRGSGQKRAIGPAMLLETKAGAVADRVQRSTWRRNITRFLFISPGWPGLCKVEHAGPSDETIPQGGVTMATLEKTIEVNLPMRAVYNQWTQFEEFPRFMEGIEEVRQLDDTHLHWRASIAGRTVEWDAEITDQIPDQQVAWRSTKGAEHSGVVRFEPIGPDRTRITTTITYDPVRVAKTVGYDPEKLETGKDEQRIVANRVQEDLGLFKRFVEERGGATGSWRGEVHGGAVDSAAPGS
jgi:uncharacterized membrane protein